MGLRRKSAGFLRNILFKGGIAQVLAIKSAQYPCFLGDNADIRAFFCAIQANFFIQSIKAPYPQKKVKKYLVYKINYFIFAMDFITSRCARACDGSGKGRLTIV